MYFVTTSPKPFPLSAKGEKTVVSRVCDTSNVYAYMLLSPWAGLDLSLLFPGSLGHGLSSKMKWAGLDWVWYKSPLP